MLLNSVIYQRLSSVLTSIKFVSYSAWLLVFLKRKILIDFNAEEGTWAFERLEHYLERENQGMLKSFSIRRNKKIFKRMFG